MRETIYRWGKYCEDRGAVWPIDPVDFCGAVVGAQVEEESKLILIYGSGRRISITADNYGDTLMFIVEDE